MSLGYVLEKTTMPCTAKGSIDSSGCCCTLWQYMAW